MFKIIGADEKEYGPITVDQLKQWIAESRVNAQTRVLTEGASEWKPLVEIPELAALLPATPPPVASGVPPMPGASALPDDVRERDYDMAIGDCVSRAWQLLTGPKMWLVIGGVAIWLAIQAGLSAFAQIPFIGLLFSLASMVIGGPLIGGVYYFLLRAIRGETAEVGDVFAGFKYRFGQLFLGQLVVMLLVLASVLPGSALLVAGTVTMVRQHDPTGGSIALIVAGSIVMLIPLFYLAIGWMFALPLIMDKALDFWPAMQLSRHVVGKHWWTTLALSLVVGIISCIGVLLCCVGVFFTMPLAFVTFLNAYERMFGLRPGGATTSAATIPLPTHI